MPDHAISIQGISYRYGTHQALQKLRFNISPGSFFGLLGPNGSGKTTLFRILSTLMPPAEGQAFILGLDTVRQAHKVRMQIGMIFQQPSLDEELTVMENLRFHGKLYGLHGNQLQDRIKYLADRIDIADRLQDRVSKLSGGLKRRADIIRGILHKPRVLLLDEPTTALDPAARHAFWQLLTQLRQEETLTLVLATHLLEEAEYCEEVVILNKGQIAAQGNPDTLRSELGEQMLWITSSNPEALAARIEAGTGYEVRIVNDALCIADKLALQSLPELYQAHGDLIESVTIRKPTLEDVFLTTTGDAFATASPNAL